MYIHQWTEFAHLGFLLVTSTGSGDVFFTDSSRFFTIGKFNCSANCSAKWNAYYLSSHCSGQRQPEPRRPDKLAGPCEPVTTYTY